MAITVPILSEWNKQALDKAQKDINSFGDKAGKAFNGLASAGRKLALGIGAIGVGAVALGKDLIAAGEAAATSNARIDQIAESMGVFGEESAVATQRIKDLANEIARKTGVDQNQIKQAQATLLTFGEIAETAGDLGSTFDRATEAAIDLAAAGFGTAESNAVQLGKALNDPVAGLSALSRSGITFTQQQKDLIASLVDSGQMLGAQTVILRAIEEQVGGTAEATANASDKMSVAFSQLQEKLGQKLLPVFERVTNWVIETLVPALENAYNVAVPRFQAAWESVSNALGPIISRLRQELTPIIERIVTFLKENTAVVKTFLTVLAGAAALAMIAALAAAIAGLANPVVLTIAGIAALAAGFKYAYDNSEEFREGFDQLASTAIALATALKEVYQILSKVESKATNLPGIGGVLGKITGPGFLVPGLDLLPQFADGGIVTGPTTALIGEAGPEAVIPLDQLGRFGGGMNVTINMPAGSNGADVLEALEREGRRRGGLPLRTASGIKL
jgi:outer membrane murein-binding lipoprotein Lpp